MSVGYIDQGELGIYRRVKGTVIIFRLQSAGSFFLRKRQNSSTEGSLRAYSQINTLGDDIVALTADLTDLRADLGVETSLSELKRLQSVVDAYGTTIVEIVRRKEFCV